MADSPLVDRKFLEKLERLAIRWQKSFPGLVGGRHASHFSGSGQEFLDHRHFHSGDDLRAVNWRAFLRLEKLFLKIFRIEPHTPVRLLIDTSASMATGTSSKFDYARKLAAALCYIGLVRLDTITLAPFNNRLAESCRCSGGRHRFGPVIDYLTQLQAEGRTNFHEVAREFSARYLSRGLLIILSDFLDDSDFERPIQNMAGMGHELLLVQLWAEEDRRPPWEGQLELTDAETGARIELDFNPNARVSYTAAFDKYMEEVRRLAIRNGGRYVSLCTSAGIEDAVFGPLVMAGTLE